MNTALLETNMTGLEITEHGLRIKRLLSLEEWKHLLQQVAKLKRAYHSVLSDATAYGRRNFGDDVVNETLEQMEFGLADAIKAETIALVGIDQRSKYGLTSEHAYILGKLLDSPEEREEWAGICQKHDLTAFELKKSIEAGHILRENEIRQNSGNTGGIPSVQSVRFHFERWRNQIKDPESIVKLPKAERRKILDLLDPIVQLAAKLETSLH